MNGRSDAQRWETFADLTARMREKFEADLLEACQVIGVVVDEKVIAEAVDETFDTVQSCGLEVEPTSDPDADYDAARDREFAL